MKQGTGISASLAAILSSVATISCCLPLGFAAALGAGAASAFVKTLRPWLLGLSVVLLRPGILAAASRHALLDPRAQDWERAVVDGSGCGVGNDSVPTGNRSIPRR